MGREVTDSEQFWETHYARGAVSESVPQPSAVFMGLISKFVDRGGKSRRALELGCGKGGDALWLAQQGWQVTAVDASQTAIDRLSDLAAEVDVSDRVSAVQADLEVEIPDGPYDLIFGCHFQSPVDIDRDAIVRRASELLVPGGLMIILDHASVAPWSWDQDMIFPTAEETLGSIGLGEWDVLVAEKRDRPATSPDGLTEATVSDNVIVVSRPDPMPH